MLLQLGLQRGLHQVLRDRGQQPALAHQLQPAGAADLVLRQQRQRVQQVQAQPVYGLRHPLHACTVRSRLTGRKRHAAHRLKRVSPLDRHQVSLLVKFPPNS
jgi:hypothetical protein